MKIKTGDEVLVIAGKDKGSQFTFQTFSYLLMASQLRLALVATL